MASVIIDPDTAKASATALNTNPGTVIFPDAATATAAVNTPDIKYDQIKPAPLATASALMRSPLGTAIVVNATISAPLMTATALMRSMIGFIPLMTASATGLSVIISTDDWWNASYMMRRRLKFSSPYVDAPVGNLVLNPVDLLALYTAGKIRSDFEDVQVVYQKNNTFTVLPKKITEDGELYFGLQEVVTRGTEDDDSYYVYYSNPDLVSEPVVGEYVENFWPVKVYPNNYGVAYTRPGEHWKEGRSSEPLAVTTLTFVGDRVRIVVDKDIDQGVAEVSLDEGDWVDIDLFNNFYLPEQIVYEQTDLVLQQHKLQVRVSGRQNPASEGYEVNVVHFDFLSLLEVEDLGEEVNENVGWVSYLGGV